MTASRAIVIVNWCCVAGAVVLLPVSIYPGYANGCMFLLALPMILTLGAIWGTIALRTFPKPFGRDLKVAGRLMVIAPILVVSTYVMLKFYIPRRIAFTAHRSSFDALLANAPAPGRPVALHKRVGLYQVDAVAVDSRGGTYFRTGIGSDVIDTLSFGFAKEPNNKGTPFGAAKLVLRPLGNGWYWFTVSDDWY